MSVYDGDQQRCCVGELRSEERGWVGPAPQKLGPCTTAAARAAHEHFTIAILRYNQILVRAECSLNDVGYSKTILFSYTLM